MSAAMSQILDEAARLGLHHAPPTPGVRLHVSVRARGKVSVDEEHVRPGMAVPPMDSLVEWAGSAGWEAGCGQGGRGGGALAASA